MPPDRTATTVVVGGGTEIERHEEILLEQMTAVLPSCPSCTTDGLYLTMWTPWRTVARICCGVCLKSLWEAP